MPPNQPLIFLNYDISNWIVLLLHWFSHEPYSKPSSAKPKHYKDAPYGLVSSFTKMSYNKHKASLGKALPRKKYWKVITFKAIFYKIHISLAGSGVQWCQQWPMVYWQDEAICWVFKGSSGKQNIFMQRPLDLEESQIKTKKLKSIPWRSLRQCFPMCWSGRFLGFFSATERALKAAIVKARIPTPSDANRIHLFRSWQGIAMPLSDIANAEQGDITKELGQAFRERGQWVLHSSCENQKRRLTLQFQAK